jgi:hypothetical protein
MKAHAHMREKMQEVEGWQRGNVPDQKTALLSGCVK